jgi:hypothetical protein
MKRGSKHTPEALVKMAEARRGKGLGNTHNCGRKLSPEHRARIGLAGLGNKHAWRGGRYQDAEGYIRVICHDHPYAHHSGYVLEHRLVMEAHLGRVLLPTEVVHHINGIPDDNRIENLMRFDSQSDHVSWHHQNNKEEES